MNVNRSPHTVREFIAQVVGALQARRLALGLSCEELGRRAGVGALHVLLLESGRVEPTLYTVARLKAVLDEADGVSMKTVRELRDLQRQMAIWRTRLEQSRERINRAEGPLRARNE